MDKNTKNVKNGFIKKIRKSAKSKFLFVFAVESLFFLPVPFFWGLRSGSARGFHGTEVK